MSGIRDLFAEEFKMHEEKEKDLEKKLAQERKFRKELEEKSQKRIKELEAQLASQKKGSKAL